MKDWYLTTPVPNITSKHEDEIISDYAESNFTDVLETSFSDCVILFNHDLSQQKKIQCVIQGNLADTQLKSMERIALAPIGTLLSGDYIFFENEYWIVDGRPGNNKSYEKAVLKECQYKLRWQKNNGKIIERWANFTSASKYDVGEGGNNVLLLSSNNYTIVIPHDKDGLTIDGKRVFIDTSDNPQKVFKITRNDDVLFIHPNHGGTLSLIADKTELNPETDRADMRLCDYINVENIESPDSEKLNFQVDILGSPTLLLGVQKAYSASVVSLNGGDLSSWDSDVFTWNVISDVEVQKQEEGNKISLLVNDLPNENIILQVISNNVVVKEMQVSVSDII